MLRLPNNNFKAAIIKASTRNDKLSWKNNRKSHENNRSYKTN